MPIRRWQRALDMAEAAEIARARAERRRDYDDGDLDDGIAAENEIDERASLAEEDAEDDEWQSWLDDEEEEE